jgi:hypothetical protein
MADDGIKYYGRETKGGAKGRGGFVNHELRE